jgi:hypothetical protein
MAYDVANCEYIRLDSAEIDTRLAKGPEMVSAKFVIPYPPGCSCGSSTSRRSTATAPARAWSC